MSESTGSPTGDAPASHVPPPAPEIAWSPEQVARLEHEWRQLQRNFAYHPFVRVTPLRGRPPAEYRIDFRARTLYVRDDGQLDYIDAPAVHVWLPPGYPHEAPLLRPMQAIFHPNVTMDGIGVNPGWEPMRTLAQLVQQVGAVLAYQTYDPWNVWNPAALEWATANAAYLPTDPNASFAPNAGGEPLGRIVQYGAPTLAELREQLGMLCASLVSPEATPTMPEIRAFAADVRVTTELFLHDDVPESLRRPARELGAWAEALPPATMVFEGLRQRHIACAAALGKAARLAEARRAVLKEIAGMAGLVARPPVADPYAALGQLPPLPTMQAAQVNLRVALAEAEKRLSAARARLAALMPPDERAARSRSELLERVIWEQTGRAAAAVRDARERLQAAIGTITPAVERAREELAAFGRVIGWREYADLTARSRELVDRIAGWGSAGVQAYFVENEGGVFGPFEFEQRLDLGESALAVRNSGRTAIEVFDLKTGGKLAHSDTGETTIQLPGGEEGVHYETTFRITARCDDLWVQLEYLNRQIADRLGRLSRPQETPRAETWARAYAEVLSRPGPVARFTAETRDGMLERDTLVSDLKQLARFKERMATQFLVERWAEMAPRFKKAQADAEAQLADANQRIAYIFARSSREPTTGQPMIPPKLAKDYEAQVKRRDDAVRKIDRMDRRFDLAVAQLRPRLSTPTLLGVDQAPEPVVLPPLGDDLLGRVGLMSMVAITELAELLERVLGEPLRPAAPALAGPPPLPATVAPAVAATAPVAPVAQAAAAPAPVAKEVVPEVGAEQELAAQEEDVAAASDEGEEGQEDFVDFSAGSGSGLQGV